MSSLDASGVGRGAAQDRDGLRRRHATALQRRDDAETAAHPADDEVVGVDLDRLAGLDDAPVAARRRAPPRSAVHEPRSDQPTSIERHHDPTVAAAPSITA